MCFGGSGRVCLRRVDFGGLGEFIVLGSLFEGVGDCEVGEILDLGWFCGFGGGGIVWVCCLCW